MDIHRAKPIRNLREFLSEIGVIVCGVIIALSLEQAVEALHWAEKVHQAKASLHFQMVIAAVFAEERAGRKSCVDTYLADLSKAIVEPPPQWKPAPADYCGEHHASVYSVPDRPWPTEVWKSVVAEGTVSHFDGDYRLKAPFLFSFIQSMADENATELDEATDLNALVYPVVLTADSRIGFLKALERLRRHNASMALSSDQMRMQIRAMGDAPTEAELAAARAGTPNFHKIGR